MESDAFYLRQPEPLKSTLLALRDIILQHDRAFSPAWKYGMPFFCIGGKMACYLWVHKKLEQPYIGLVEGKAFEENYLLQENRSRMKIMLIDPNRDLPLADIQHILTKISSLYQQK